MLDVTTRITARARATTRARTTTRARAMTRAAASLAAGLLLLGALTACSGSGTVTTSGPTLAIDEAALAKAIGKKVGTDVTVTCPDNVPLRKGEVTLCTVTDGVYVNELLLTQEDDVGNIAWEVGKVLSGPSS